MGLSVRKDRQIKDDWYLETWDAQQHRTGGTGVNRPCNQMMPALCGVQMEKQRHQIKSFVCCLLINARLFMQ